MVRTRMDDASPSYSTTVRLEAPVSPRLLSDLARSLNERGGEVVAIDLVEATASGVRVDVTFHAVDVRHVEVITDGLRADGYVVRNVSDRTFLAHLGGAIEVVPRAAVRTRDDLSLVYTPGVARISRSISEHPETAWNLTGKGNTVAVVTDGSAVLGLGDVGPLAALPVMEGKAALFKTFADVNAFPICLATTDPDEIVAAVCAIAPGFGGVNLEDIAAPRCFEVEARLQDALGIPVFHDDQHGTAVVVLAGLINACRITDRTLEDLRAVVIGIGAAGTAISKMLLDSGVENLVAVDRDGPLRPDDPSLLPHQREIVSRSTAHRAATIEEALDGADVVVGVSRRGAWEPEVVAKMAPNPIVFALANPEPEVYLDEIPPGALLATGRSDLPNQVNNALCFPGIFRGALEAHAHRITTRMQEAAAHAIAEAVTDTERAIGVIVPSLFHADVHAKVAAAVEAVARQESARPPAASASTGG